MRFWDVSSVHIALLYKLTTAEMFGGYAGKSDGFETDGDEEWPPFRKVRVCLNNGKYYFLSAQIH